VCVTCARVRLGACGGGENNTCVCVYVCVGSWGENKKEGSGRKKSTGGNLCVCVRAYVCVFKSLKNEKRR
jgi:hypothetical protein